MKFLETNFIDYIQKCKKSNLHSELSQPFKSITDIFNKNHNIILYGPSGVGKYTQALNYIEQFSPTNLKYERKINFIFNKKHDYMFKVSDIHFEVDMELLGCNAKTLWNEIYYRVLDIIAAKVQHKGIIICKNFHKIHSELLDIFYSYMQTLEHKNIKLSYIIITEQISFLPNNILDRCNIISIRRPTKNKYSKCLNIKFPKDVDLHDISNIKNLYTKEIQLHKPNRKKINCILNDIKNYEELNYLQFRDQLYDIFIYHLDLNECIWEILYNIFIEYNLCQESISRILVELYKFLKYYNNNYRPIYHLEKFMLYLCKEIHGL